MARYEGGDQMLSLVNGFTELSEEEKEHLLTVMNKAKEFEIQEEKKRMKPFEGQLLKYTNVVKGWQPRWFVLTPHRGVLEYYMPSELKQKRPRGGVFLAGAEISPSAEDSLAFTVSAASGDVYRLQAHNAKERQTWIDKLRDVADIHNQFIAKENPPLPPWEYQPTFEKRKPVGKDISFSSDTSRTPNVWYLSPDKTTSPDHSLESPIVDPVDTFSGGFVSPREMLTRTECNHQALVKAIENLPPDGKIAHPLDKELLLLKATSQATVLCLEQCLSIIQHKASSQAKVQDDSRMKDLISSGTNVSFLSSSSHPLTKMDHTAPFLSITSPEQPELVDPSGEVTDEEDDRNEDCGSVDDMKNVVLPLLSQLKLGVDLTKVVFPTFILEPRSLLEMFADYLGHPDSFIRIAEAQSPEKRMIAVVEWFLASFHVGYKGSAAKKPYNPIIGETFRCSWKVRKKDVCQNVPVSSSSSGIHLLDEEYCMLTYVAEQVSHHPPVSAFYVECPEKRIYMNGHVWTKSKFLGMSIGVNMVGEVKVTLVDYQETYVFSLPSAYARSILTSPWVELGGRVTIFCSKSGCSSVVTFHTKPFYGGKLHRVTAEVKNCVGDVICRVGGEWNTSLTFTYQDGSIKNLNVENLPKVPKRVRPVEKQDENESRKLWERVTTAIRVNDMFAATTEKQILEEKQRREEECREAAGVRYQGKLFSFSDSSGWMYKYALTNIE
ncbi:oxysterol-binding protein-related protein 11-like isoform X2 [Tachypleus tridentatus]|uniref:oxysterol-binding protein-related protein 11-like isoform X2 n=1 Tax=Tachypleus tridentatus TaxID=6853 RepID=UPI003FCFF30D